MKGSMDILVKLALILLLIGPPPSSSTFLLQKGEKNLNELTWLTGNRVNTGR